MKKLLAALVIAALAPITTFAISINDITNNPDQYTKVDENIDAEVYVDNNSIQSLRYSPPFYSMQGTVYAVSYQDNCIVESTEVINYDYNKSFTNTVKRVSSNYKRSEINKLVLAKMAEATVEQLEKDSGIKEQDKTLKFWTLNGNYITGKEYESFEGSYKPVKYGTIGYQISLYIFKKYYDTDF